MVALLLNRFLELQRSLRYMRLLRLDCLPSLQTIHATIRAASD